MFKRILAILLFFFAFGVFMPSSNVNASSEAPIYNLNIYFFHTEGCSHCANMQILLDDIKDEYGDKVTIYSYNVTGDAQNSALLSKIASGFGEESATTPFVSLGGKYYVGYNSSTDYLVRKYVEKYTTQEEWVDVTFKIINDEVVLDSDFDLSVDEEYNLPLIGMVNVKDISLVLITVVMGFVDGFNPCAMWVLLFLISMFVAQKNRKRMWFLGSLFLFTSAAVYFLMMIAWLNTVAIVSAKLWFQLVIGIFALAAGGYNLYKFIKKAREDAVGCDVVDVKKKKKIFEKVKKIVSQKSLMIAAAGIMLLAITFNFIELACSAGLPLLYSNILSLNGVTGFSSVLYILLYVLFFLIDDLVVFTIAMLTLKVTGVTNKYTKYSSLIGGIIMILIGISMIFFPNIIMLNF